MFNINIDFQSFVFELQEIVHSNTDELFLSSTQGLRSPTITFRSLNVSEYRFEVKNLSANELELLSLGSWFLGEGFRQKLQLEIIETLECRKDFLINGRIFPLLSNKNDALAFFYNCRRISGNTWYGNYVSLMKRCFKTLKLRVFKTNPNARYKKFSGWIRGPKTSRAAKKVDQQVLDNYNLYYQKREKERINEYRETEGFLLFLAGLNDDQREIERLLQQREEHDYKLLK